MNYFYQAVSDNVYKEKHREDCTIPPSYCALSTTPQIKHVQEVGDKISNVRFK